MASIEENKKLIARYPFLIPRNVFTDKVPENYDYSYTLLDDMPSAWSNCFGEFLCEDLRELLIRSNYLDKYRITQIKEKFGELRWYDNGVPMSVHEEYCILMDKYREISHYVCVNCGAFPANVCIVSGWIVPYCSTCYKSLKGKKRIDTEDVFEPTFTMTKYKNGKSELYTVDCSDIANRIIAKQKAARP